MEIYLSALWMEWILDNINWDALHPYYENEERTYRKRKIVSLPEQLILPKKIQNITNVGYTTAPLQEGAQKGNGHHIVVTLVLILIPLPNDKIDKWLSSLKNSHITYH